MNEFGEKKTTFAYQKNFLFFASKTFTFATQSRGSKQYELTDHLGNIRTVVPDIKEPLSLPQNQNFRLPTLTLNKTTPTACCRQGVLKMRGYRFGYSFSLHTPIFTQPSPTLLLNQSNTITLNALVVFR
mgnify:CR=1 FL=1